MKFAYKDNNQYQLLGGKYKDDLKRRSDAVEYEEYKKTASGNAVTATVKMDGEFSVPVLEHGEGKIYSPGKKAAIRWDFQACREFENTLLKKGYTDAVFYAELYGAYPDGKPMKFNKVSSLIAELHGFRTDKELRIGIFDVESLNGAKVAETDYWKRYELIHSIFGGLEFCHPVVAKHEGGLDLFEKYVNSEGFEGLVVRTSHKVLKVKNLFTSDMVIYAIMKKGENMKLTPPRFGSVCVGLILPSGELIDMGSVGNGWDADERLALHKELMADKFSEDSALIYVKPKHILEVGYTEMMMPKPMATFTLLPDGTFVKTGRKSEGYSPRFPKRIPYVDPTGQRGDYPMISDHPKKVTEADIGVRQVPEMAESYGVTEDEPETLSMAGQITLSGPPIKANASTVDVIKDKGDTLTGVNLIREDNPAPFILKFIPQSGISMKDLMLQAKMPLMDIQVQLEDLLKKGLIVRRNGMVAKV